MGLDLLRLSTVDHHTLISLLILFDPLEMSRSFLRSSCASSSSSIGVLGDRFWGGPPDRLGEEDERLAGTGCLADPEMEGVSSKDWRTRNPFRLGVRGVRGVTGGRVEGGCGPFVWTKLLPSGLICKSQYIIIFIYLIQTDTLLYDYMK